MTRPHPTFKQTLPFKKILDRGFAVIGLTGTIGSGKTTVAELLKAKGAFIIDADLLSREVVSPSTPALGEIVAHFGKSVLNADGSLNRGALANIVFKDKNQLLALEKIVHPRIFARSIEILEELEKSSFSGIVIYMAPLLFESGIMKGYLDATIVVDAQKEDCLSRVQERDKCSRKQAEDRYNSQLDPAEKRRLADFVICNMGGLEELQKEVDNWYLSIIENPPQ